MTIKLQPYTKNYNIFKCPSNPNAWIIANSDGAACAQAGCGGVGYGGENSYGHNDMWLSPAGSYAGTGGAPFVVTLASIPRPASTIMVTDATYYGVGSDVYGDSGTQPNNYGNSEQTEAANYQAFLNDQGAQYNNYWQNIGNGVWS